jgi:hypothetical protein
VAVIHAGGAPRLGAIFAVRSTIAEDAAAHDDHSKTWQGRSEHLA